MKFAFLILGDFCPETDRAAIHGGAAQMRGVSTLEDACAAARELLEKTNRLHRAVRRLRPGRRAEDHRGHREPDSGGICHPPAGAGGRLPRRFPQ